MVASAPPHHLRPQARRARIIALLLSAGAVGFSLGFGVYVRRTIALFDESHPERYTRALVFALVFLLVALLLRMAAAICELIWLERTWTNLPESLRRIGPIDRVSSGMVVGISFVPGLSWIWKLALVMAMADGFERLRSTIPFRARVPRNLGMAAVIVAWVPGLNVYVAPFLWEMFATRIDVVCGELLAATTASSAAPPTT